MKKMFMGSEVLPMLFAHSGDTEQDSRFTACWVGSTRVKDQGQDSGL